VSPVNIQFFTPVLPSTFGPRYHSQHPIISLPRIYSSSSQCYLPLLAPDITLSTLLSVSPKYTVLHPSVTFHFCPQISFSAPYYQSPYNIQFFTPLLPSNFGTRYHSQHPIMSLTSIYSSSFLCYLPLLAPVITLSTLLSVSPQYRVLHSCVTFPFWSPISLSAPYYEPPHNIKFFIPVLPSAFGLVIILSTLLSVSPQYTVLHSWLPSLFGPRYHSQNPIMSLPTIYSSSPLYYLHLFPRYHSQHPIMSLLKYRVLHSCVTFHFWP